MIVDHVVLEVKDVGGGIVSRMVGSIGLLPSLCFKG